MQEAREGRLHPAVGRARQLTARLLTEHFGKDSVQPTGRTRRACVREASELPLLLVACSGGPDSLALASIAAHFARRGDMRVGAVIVDHQLQEGSGQVAEETAQTLRSMGLAPVVIERATVNDTRLGPEMAARNARYEVFTRVAHQLGAHAILLGHTRNDQAETVLLGLSRGSGTRSLAGMPTHKEEQGVTYLRPLLDMSRDEIEDICAAEALTPWIDPTNADTSLMRSRVRHEILPFLQEHLGGDIMRALAQTATIVGADSEYLSQQAQLAFEAVQRVPVDPQDFSIASLQPATSFCALDRVALMELPRALRSRVLALAVAAAEGVSVNFERLRALEDFASEHSIAGPVQMPGKVSAYRRRRVPVAGAGEQNRRADLLILLSTRAAAGS
ncbi:MAG: tRNA lysidine(34) synthetase TilS [Rothia sp. (in: high G+C Gram-positive bacteria)]|uniref:tRNA lysidine(34) synthetase TilS n=1 Tax=Rothia sp. (in: high G+C Gram-positive bacteria) TaxID=1885016 RepID=UPI0026DF5EAB|nr:tRNA lysidine(34) synthetase TilS [Rothia sp. (in: high G+C Gram-positive bacteria)]MDO5749723.1 tRNA lysidine(34) synthetase TilS [Rothia sp. (in: high G+C Gram-positive bacteria)]